MSKGVAICGGCGLEFALTRRGLRFCKVPECVSVRTKARWKKWYDKGQRDGINDYQRDYRSRTMYGKDYDLRKKYGITLVQWDLMVRAAGGACQICGHDGSVESLVVDHDHATGRVRGVLCRKCNRSIGALGDTAEGIEKAFEYLKNEAKMGSILYPNGFTGRQ